MAGLETAADVFAVISLSAKVAKLCSEYLANVKDAKDDVERLTKEIEIVGATFTRAQELLKVPDSARLLAFQNLNDTLIECVSQLEELNDRLDLKNQNGTRRIGWRAPKWPFETRQVDKIIQNLAGYKQTILVALQIDQTTPTEHPPASIPPTEYSIPSTEYSIPSTKYSIPPTEYSSVEVPHAKHTHHPKASSIVKSRTSHHQHYSTHANLLSSADIEIEDFEMKDIETGDFGIKDIGTEDGYRHAALYEAASRGRGADVRVLLERGADLGAVDRYGGCTALHVAASRGYEAVVRVLLEYGADIEATPNEGWTPLRVASRNGHEGVVRVLLEKGANVNGTDSNGRTALHRAAKEGEGGVVQLLLDDGADASVKNKDGQTALQVAAINGHLGIVNILEQRVKATPSIANAPESTLQQSATSNSAVDTIPLRPATEAGDGPTAVLPLGGGAESAGTPSLSSQHPGQIILNIIDRRFDEGGDDEPDDASVTLQLRGRHPTLEHISQSRIRDMIPQASPRLSKSSLSKVDNQTKQIISEEDQPEGNTESEPNPQINEQLGMISSHTSNETQITDYSFSDTTSDDSDVHAPSNDGIRTKELPPGIDSDEIFLNPQRYFQEIDDLRAEMYQHSAIYFCRSLESEDYAPNQKWIWRIPADKMSRIREDEEEIRVYCGQSIENPTQDKFAEDLFHLLECRNLIFAVCKKISILRSTGFNEEYFSMLIEDRRRENVAKLIPISFQKVENLADSFDAMLDFARENKETFILRDGAEKGVKKSNVFSSLIGQCADLLDNLDFLGGFDDDLDPRKLPPRFLWHCAVQILDLGVLSYSCVHTEPLDTMLDELLLPSPHVELGLEGDATNWPRPFPISMRRRTLNCLDTFFRGKQVWVFHQSHVPLPKDDRLYLSTAVEYFADIWGPLWKSCPATMPDEITCYLVGNGLILPWHQDPNQGPRIEPGEILCHWIPRAIRGPINDEIRAKMHVRLSSPRGIFSGKETLLIGAQGSTRESPRLRCNPNCNTTPDQIDEILINSGCRRSLGTQEPLLQIDSSQISMQWGSGGFGPSVGGSRTYKTTGGRTLKETFLEAWELSPERRNIRVIGDAQYGVTVSACTKNAQRTCLYSILCTSTMSIYLKSLQWSTIECRTEFFEALGHGDSIVALRELWEGHEEWREEIGRKIFLCIRELNNTGVSESGQLSALWIPGPHREYIATLVQKSHSWTPLLKDSVHYCTMAVLETRCLESIDDEGGRRCQGPYLNDNYGKGFPVFETRLIINPRGTIPEGIEPRPHAGKHSQRWSVSKARKNSEIFLGSQGRLRVISSLKRGGLLVEWDNNVLKDLTQEIKKSFRERVLRDSQSPCHREYILYEKLDLKPIPLLVISS